jgi:hypothetical protein
LKIDFPVINWSTFGHQTATFYQASNDASFYAALPCAAQHCEPHGFAGATRWACHDCRLSAVVAVCKLLSCMMQPSKYLHLDESLPGSEKIPRMRKELTPRHVWRCIRLTSHPGHMQAAYELHTLSLSKRREPMCGEHCRSITDEWSHLTRNTQMYWAWSELAKSPVPQIVVLYTNVSMTFPKSHSGLGLLCIYDFAISTPSDCLSALMQPDMPKATYQPCE